LDRTVRYRYAAAPASATCRNTTVTVAPELPGALDLIQDIVSANAVGMAFHFQLQLRIGQHNS